MSADSSDDVAVATRDESLNGPGSEAQEAGLLRALGRSMAVALVAGNVIGSGIFAKPGQIATDGGDFRLIMTAWIVGGLLCVLGALCFAELATMLPKAGGLYVYLREAYSPGVAFLFGWAEFLFFRPAQIGALATIFAGSFLRLLGVDITRLGPASLPEVSLAMISIALMAWVNVLGVIWGGRVQWGTTLVKAGFLGLMGLLPFLMLAVGSAHVDAANYATRVVPANPSPTVQFGAVLLAVMWAYNGWHNITPVAEEIQDPQRNIPFGLFAGIALVMSLYLLANVAYHGVLSMEEVRAAGDHTAEKMIEVLLGPAGAAAMSAVIIVSVFGAMNSNLMLGPRVSFAMGRDRVFFPQLGKVHPEYRTPAVAIVLQAAMAVALVIASAFLVRNSGLFQERSVFQMLTDYAIFSASIFYSLGVLAVVVLRFKRPDLERPYRTWGYPLVPAAFLIVYAWFLWQVFIDKKFEAVVGLGLIGLGVPAYFLFQWLKPHDSNAGKH